MVACASLLANLDPTCRVTVHVVDCGLSPCGAAYIVEKLSSATAEVVLHTLAEALPMTTRLEHWTPAVLGRLFLESLLFGTTDRLLYLDADVVVLGDVTELYAFDLRGRAVGAVPNIIEPWRSWDVGTVPARHRRDGAQPPGYFNSGVLLIDLVRWHRLGGTRRALDIYRAHGTSFVAPDQDTLNVLFSGDWVRIPSRWNRLVAVSGRALPVARPVTPDEEVDLMHFIGPVKPWDDGFPAGRPLEVYRSCAAKAEVVFEAGRPERRLGADGRR